MLVIPVDIDPSKLKILFKMKLELIFLPRSKFNIKHFNNSDMVGNKAFNALSEHLKHKTLTVSPSGTQIGCIDSIPITISENKTKMLLRSDVVSQLNLFEKKSSLFNSLNSCYTAIGEEKLKLWIQTPLINISCIKKRQLQQDFLENHIQLIDQTLKSIKIPDFSKPININQIKELICKCLILDSYIYLAVKLKHKENYRSLLLFLSEYTEKGIIKGIDSELDCLRKMIKDLPSFLDQLAAKIANELGIELSIIYFPQIGYVIESEKLNELSTMIEENNFKNSFTCYRNYVRDCEPAEPPDKNTPAYDNKHINKLQINLIQKQNPSISSNHSKLLQSKIFEDEDIDKSVTFEIKNCTIRKLFCKIKNRFYYKTEEMIDLDETFGDVFIKIKEQEMRIKEKFLERIQSENFSYIFDFIAKIDATASLIRYKIRNRCNKVNLIEIPEKSKNVPEIEIVCDNLKYHLRRNSIVHCEKDFTYKIGQFIILAQISGYIPCLSATIPVFNSILISRPKITKKIKFVEQMELLSTFITVNTKKTLILTEYYEGITERNQNMAIFMALHDYYVNSFSITFTDFDVNKIIKLYDKMNSNGDKLTFYYYNFEKEILEDHSKCVYCFKK
ncbi:hypothetical protein NUSPORA_00162 [Nucleospora cyclopteri]